MKSLLFLVFVVTTLICQTHARSLTPNDVPDPPKKTAFRLPPLMVAPFARAHFTAKDQQQHLPLNNPKKNEVPTSTRDDPRSKVPRLPISKTPVQVVSHVNKVEPKQVPKPLSHDEQDKTKSLKPIMIHRGSLVIPVMPGKNINFAQKDGTTVKPPVTTTVDPWVEFCKEACEEGMAGPECDCAEHPIGRRHAPILRQSFVESPKPFISQTRKNPIQHPPIVRPANRPDASDPIVPDVRPSEGDSAEAHGDGENSTTTKDPLVEFCQVACKEGQGGLACDCRDHIIG